jgi:hypothetical protein
VPSGAGEIAASSIHAAVGAGMARTSTTQVMNKIPFSIYDFFGYLACGFVLLTAVDFAFNRGQLLKQKPDGFTAIVFFWIILVYSTGHLIANISAYLLESKLVRGVLKSPEELLFHDHKPKTVWARLFPGYYSPLPKHTRERVLAKSQERCGLSAPGRALFFHCHPIVKREQVTLERLNNFINAYGFCRNMSLTAIAAAIVVLYPVVSAAIWLHTSVPEQNLWWAALGIVIGLGMFYRYIKFFRLYTVEVFITYAETEVSKDGLKEAANV